MHCGSYLDIVWDQSNKKEIQDIKGGCKDNTRDEKRADLGDLCPMVWVIFLSDEFIGCHNVCIRFI